VISLPSRTSRAVNSPFGAVAVDGGNLGRPPRHAVHDVGVEQPGRVRERETVQLVVGPGERALLVDRARELRVAEADVEVELPRLGDLVSPEPPERAAVGSTDKLSAEVAVEECVLAVSRAGLPPRRLGGEEPTGAPNRAAPPTAAAYAGRARRPGLVAQRLTHRDALLPGLRELGPPPGDRVIERENVSIDQDEDAERRHRLRHRVEVHECVALEALATPQVGHNATTHGREVPGPRLAELVEATDERVAEAVEPTRDLSMNHGPNV
jgi:hypothetical protein